MKRIYDFRCSKGHLQEHFVEYDAKSVRCDCGAKSKRVVSPANFTLEGTSGDFPGANMKWIKEHEKRGGFTDDE